MLASKSELDKALDRRRWQQGKNEAKQEADAAKTDFQKAMEQRAQRVNHVRNRVFIKVIRGVGGCASGLKK